MIKTAFITDWLDKYGGAERVVTAINEIYEFDYYYAYVNMMSSQLQKKTFAGREVNVISSNIMSVFKYKFRVTMPFFPLIINKFNKQTKNNEIDLLISSSWTMSKGYRSGNELHICYLQARNFKYIWEEADLYFKGPLKLVSFIKGYLQRFDLKSARNPDYLISNSIFVKNWVKEKYKRDSVVIYPPVDVEDFYISDTSEDYYITVGRLEPYKRFDIIVEAFTNNKMKLVVIGDGTELKYLKSIAGSNIEFKGYLDKEKIKDYLSKSKAFVFAGVEDFGIVIIEAHASGVPSIVFKGGAANEIINEVNGLCYEIQSSDSLNKKIIDFENQYLLYDKNKIRESSLKFSKERFKYEMKTYIESLKLKHFCI
jgi:glycosyltransferase involved in cell wall biosynthesis